MASNLKIKDQLNETRFVLSDGSGTDADPYIVHHVARLYDGTGSPIASGASAPGSTERGLVVRNIPTGSYINNLAQWNGTGLTTANALPIQPGTGAVFSVTGEARQAAASALNATVVGAVEVRQSLASALRATAEIYQSAPSALRGTMEVYQSLASALNAQVVGELAHDAVDAGNPVKFGGKALEASPANVAHLDRVNAYFDKAGRQFVRSGHQSQDQWTATCSPGNTGIRATATKSAGASTTRNVCTGFTVTMIGGSSIPTASYLNVSLIDGTSGTNYLWTTTLGITAVAGATAGLTRSGLWIKSSQASALTLEFSTASANVVQSVSMEGTTISE